MMELTTTDCDAEIDALEGRLIAFRRDLHAHPEVGFTEKRTTEKISAVLEIAGLRPQRLKIGTGLVCEIGSGDPVVALRADIDAIAVEERNATDYVSTNRGISHACGHDVHTAALVGTALALARAKDTLQGTVRCIFEPAEETIPGGALDVINEGHMNGVQRLFAFHCDPSLDVGKIGVRAGPLTAATDVLHIELKGAGGHTARVHLSSDLVYIASRIVTDLPANLSRLVDPRAGMSVVFGEISAGTAPNVLPRSAHIAGAMRCLDPKAWHDAPELIGGLIKHIVEPLNGEFSLDYRRGNPPVVNDEHATEILARAARGVVGDAGVVPTPQSLGGEDFAWLLDHAPGSMARLGVRRSPEMQTDLHSSTFDVDESAIGIAAKTLARAVIASLAE